MGRDKAFHRKRLAAILRYIANMHEDINSSGGFSHHRFVRPYDDVGVDGGDFFQRETSGEEENRIFFSTNDFRKVMSIESNDDNSRTDKESPPFSFYAPKIPKTNSREPASFAAGLYPSSLNGLPPLFSSHKSRGRRNESGKGLWLRLRRLGPSSVMQQPNYDHPVLQSYLNDWLRESSSASCVGDLLTIHNLDRAPNIPNTVTMRSHRFIKSFLRRYRMYLRTKVYQQTLEPIYNSLFEWNQQQNEKDEEVIWGLGHAQLLTSDGRLINGPLLEVLVEVELASDGALLIRPREHTGVTLNREVVTAIAASGADASSKHSALSKLHRAVGNLETSILSPGQPQTYVSLLKRIALELSPGGTFQASTNISTPLSNTIPRMKDTKEMNELSKLRISEAWCLYVRSKPSSVWARDANLLADRVGNEEDFFPIATWSLTHGPSKLEQVLQQTLRAKDCATMTAKRGRIPRWLYGNILSNGRTRIKAGKPNEKASSSGFPNKPILPLATSGSQDRIADLLLRQKYPAVIAEGPPGTGKTHTIANIVSAYLCKGKRVLVTSKNANALTVLRSRLPQSVRELVVDVSMSESQGMRQLQQTVERLAVRVSVASTDIEAEKCSLLQRSIDQLDTKLHEIDQKMSDQSERIRQLLRRPEGVVLVEKASNLITAAPWLMQSLSKMSLKNLKILANDLKALQLDSEDSILSVTEFKIPPSNNLISLASAKSGSSLSSLYQFSRTTLASVPIFGLSIGACNKKLIEELDEIQLNGSKPESLDDWNIITKALKYSLIVHTFEESIWMPLMKERKWPRVSFKDQKIVDKLYKLLILAVEVKELHILLDAENEMRAITECRKLDRIRTRLLSQKRHHSEELADAAVVAELSRSFTPDAQSALIKFAQVAGAAKFSRSAKQSKMSQRQRRRRHEYLTAFDRCCRFIPCWILTTSQISDYLPAECLFDLVVIDESSQSDVRVLPGMMRGKQWLIVGDGKQVSPTEAFVSEENIENLRASLPDSPLEDALLPGRSFFDMCAQAFPRGRVVLHEHFRCAPEIIEFSNKLCYDGRLIPVRLPTKRDRFVPSIVDVMVTGGTKIGKVNEEEADKIVAMVKEMMIDSSEKRSTPRSIGIISLIGDEQSRLIRGRLLDSCGPEFLVRHDVLIGDPPQFQGAERDIVYLSMVCSKENCPTQNQQFHFQRANVALSRARDKVVLVRSIELRDIPSLDDIKVPIIEFFLGANEPTKTEGEDGQDNGIHTEAMCREKYFGREILELCLVEKGYHIFDMSAIWKNAFCVEHELGATRVAVLVDCEEPHQSDWLSSYVQQKGIERVGWKCLRVDALSIFVDYNAVVRDVIRFLAQNGISQPTLMNEENESVTQGNTVNQEALERDKRLKINNPDVIEIDDDGDEAIARSSEEGKVNMNDNVDSITPDQIKSSAVFGQEDNIEAWKFGEVVDLDFLRVRSTDSDLNYELISRSNDGPLKESPTNNDPLNGKRTVNDCIDWEESRQSRMQSSHSDKSEDINVEQIESAGQMFDTIAENNSMRKSRKRRKISKNSRDEPWYPDTNMTEHSISDEDWIDTDYDVETDNFLEQRRPGR